MSTSPIDAVIADLSVADSELATAVAACEKCRADFDALSTTAAGMATALTGWSDRAPAPALPHPDVPAAKTDGLQNVTLAETNASTTGDDWLATARSVARQAEATRMAAKSAATSARSAATDYGRATANFARLHDRLESLQRELTAVRGVVEGLEIVDPVIAADVLSKLAPVILQMAQGVDSDRLVLDQQLLLERALVTPMPASPRELRSKLTSAAYKIKAASSQATAVATTLREAAAS